VVIRRREEWSPIVQPRTVGEIMQTEVAALSPGERLDLADDAMRLGRVRHIPVVEAGRIVGTVSSHDVLAASLAGVLDHAESDRRALLRRVEVEAVMSHEIVAIDPETTLREAAELLVTHKIGCLPVVRPDRTLLGLVTETDLLRAVLLAGDDEPEVEGEPRALRDRISAELEAVQQIRDELDVEINLAKAEVADLWASMEHKRVELESKLKAASKRAEEPLYELGATARLLLEEIREGYRRIRDIL
jgi:CBS domain-containing protein